MNKFVRGFALMSVATGLAAYAQDGGTFADDEVAEAAEQAIAAKQQNQLKFFTALPFCRSVEGVVQVLKPGASEWAEIEDGKFYPLGTTYRSVGETSRLTLSFGSECSVTITGNASFGTRAQALGSDGRSISLKSGRLSVKLPTNMPDGQFSVSAPGFTVSNMAGVSRYSYSTTGDGDDVTIRCVTGTLSVGGRHFDILAMRAADEVRIRTSQDVLFTGIYGNSGDYVVRLDQGLVEVKDIESGASSIEQKFLDWDMSPQTAVRIHRAVPDIGKNMAVSVMTFDASGDLKNRCAFTENRYELNSGELAPISKSNREELAKKAAEAADTVAVEVEADDEEEEEGSPSEASADDEYEDEDEDF